MSDEATKEQDRTGPISDEEAKQILSRFNASHWKKSRPTGGEVARYSIPADPRRDDDIRLGAYINQTRAMRAERDRLQAERDEARADAHILWHAYDSDNRPPADVLERAKKYKLLPETP